MKRMLMKEERDRIDLVNALNLVKNEHQKSISIKPLISSK